MSTPSSACIPVWDLCLPAHLKPCMIKGEVVAFACGLVVRVHSTLLALLSVLRLPHEHLFCPLFLSLLRLVLQSLAPFSYRFSFFLCSLMCFAILMPRGKVPHSCRVGTFRQGRRCHGLAVPPFMFCGRYPASQPRYTQERQRCVLAM